MDANVVRIIDARSDTVTQATVEMRQAMAQAVVGDDVFGDDPTMLEFERAAAVMFGKESAVFVPSGTMGNLIALLVHCPERDSEVIVGDQAHIHYYEQGGMAQIGGIHHRTVKNNPDGTFDLKELEDKIRVVEDEDDVPVTKLVCVENTHNRCGGVVLPMQFLKELKEIAAANNIAVHMDGARLTNASVKLNIPCHEMTKYCDSVCVCMSKALCSPIGSVLCGSKDFIKRARRYRKVLGGGMRQVGHLAAACLISLNKMISRLHEDHSNAALFATKVNSLGNPLLCVNMESVQTNMALLKCAGSKFTAQYLSDELSKPFKYKDDSEYVILTSVFGKQLLRFTFHLYIKEEHVHIKKKRKRK